jgi:hypothetical protein
LNQIPFKKKIFIHTGLPAMSLYSRFTQLLGRCINIQQKSDEWLSMRRTRITGSTAHSIHAMKEDMKPYYDALFEKLGMASGFEGNMFTAWGSHLEDFAIDRLQRDHPSLEIRQVGFIPHATDPRIGVSPDAIAFDSSKELILLIEVKCPFLRTIRGGIKKEYQSQVQLSLEVLRSHGIECECLFVQYNPHPTEDVVYEYVRRDGAWASTFFENLELFWDDLECWRGKRPEDHPLYSEWALRSEKRNRPIFVSRVMEQKFFKHVVVL